MVEVDIIDSGKGVRAGVTKSKWFMNLTSKSDGLCRGHGGRRKMCFLLLIGRLDGYMRTVVLGSSLN